MRNDTTTIMWRWVRLAGQLLARRPLAFGFIIILSFLDLEFHDPIEMLPRLALILGILQAGFLLAAESDVSFVNRQAQFHAWLRTMRGVLSIFIVDVIILGMLLFLMKDSYIGAHAGAGLGDLVILYMVWQPFVSIQTGLLAFEGLPFRSTWIISWKFYHWNSPWPLSGDSRDTHEIGQLRQAIRGIELSSFVMVLVYSLIPHLSRPVFIGLLIPFLSCLNYVIYREFRVNQTTNKKIVQTTDLAIRQKPATIKEA